MCCFFYLLQATEMKFKLVQTKKGINWHMHLRRSRDGLASCMTSCRALNRVIWRTLSSLSRLHFLWVDVIPRKLFPWSAMDCVLSFNNWGKMTCLPVGTARVLVLLAWLESRANSWGNRCGRRMGYLGCLGLNHVPIPGAPWWNCSPTWITWVERENWTADTRMRKNGFWSGESNRSVPVQL